MEPSTGKTLSIPTFYDPEDDRRGCKTRDPEIFYPERGEGANKQLAKKICRECPLRVECLRWALINNEEHGIWGATTPKERERLRHKSTLSS